MPTAGDSAKRKKPAAKPAKAAKGGKGNPAPLSERVASAIGTLAEVCGEDALPKLGAELAADEGYFAAGELAILQEMEVRTVISDPLASRRRRNLPALESKVLRRARAAVQSRSGQALLRRRGEHLARGFCHVLDHGGRRRATLRSCEKLTKAYYGAILGHNLAVLMRHLHGCRTPKTVGRDRPFDSVALALLPHHCQAVFAVSSPTLRTRE